ncbi:hypothetical protein ACP49_16215 [Clostridium botulinum]|uniref:hypothetical protein n=1 Tax=Clostridium botulinum TaxID=1491 RepID=UPI0005F9330F|nr:hypothetical protein [Clostridium botulinum]KOM97077.1 hypothetical protein ACP53_11390 [Clostridium botulinum]KOM99494.1 hypothetical protein ACP49_16215 [Clostridium botulinum]MBY7004552.1 hypothetical protein [Clostridium botulinum]MCR1147217.1 hypothetical protein [Clostridium botulinum]NFH94512.1 hypothetical protein [Clostridium botulinum]
MLEELKKYLREEDNENILNDILKDGEKYLNRLAGIELDYFNNILAKTLLLDYCRYKYNNASEYFLENFSEDILRLQLESAVKDYAKQNASDEKISTNQE